MTTTHIPTVPPKARHNPSGKPSPTHAKPARGNMKPGEIKPLVMAARKAFEIQLSLANLDADETFDTWRHRECMAAVGRPGITSCNHEDYRPLLAHFQHLSGDDDQAFSNSMKGGKPADNAAPGDTWEARRHRAHLIAEILGSHAYLATSSDDQIRSEKAPEFHADFLARKASIAAHAKGHITVGYLTYLVRQKTRRPNLSLGSDWEAGLSDRCTKWQLDQLLYTIQNRVNAIEGLGSATRRNSKQKSKSAKDAHDPGEFSEPRW